MLDKKAPRTFPLRVNQEWLDRIDDYKDRRESKHEFILDAVEEKIKQKKAGYDTLREDN